MLEQYLVEQGVDERGHVQLLRRVPLGESRVVHRVLVPEVGDGRLPALGRLPRALDEFRTGGTVLFEIREDDLVLRSQRGAGIVGETTCGATALITQRVCQNPSACSATAGTSANTTPNRPAGRAITSHSTTAA